MMKILPLSQKVVVIFHPFSSEVGQAGRKASWVPVRIARVTSLILWLLWSEHL